MDFEVKNAAWLIKWAGHHLEITLPLTSLDELVCRRLFTVVLKRCELGVP